MKSMLTNKLGGYSTSSNTYNQPKTTKYTKEELEEAKNSVQNLGKGIGGISQTNTNNYRKQFKPQLDSNDNIYKKPGTGLSQKPQVQSENFVVEPKQQTKMGSGTQLNSRFNFAQKFGTSSGNNVNQNSNNIGSYTSSKLSSTVKTNGNMTNTNINNTNSIGGTMKTKPIVTKPMQSMTQKLDNYSNDKYNYQPVEDNRKLKGE